MIHLTSPNAHNTADPQPTAGGRNLSTMDTAVRQGLCWPSSQSCFWYAGAGISAGLLASLQLRAEVRLCQEATVARPDDLV